MDKLVLNNKELMSKIWLELVTPVDCTKGEEKPVSYWVDYTLLMKNLISIKSNIHPFQHDKYDEGMLKAVNVIIDMLKEAYSVHL